MQQVQHFVNYTFYIYTGVLSYLTACFLVYITLETVLAVVFAFKIDGIARESAKMDMKKVHENMDAFFKDEDTKSKVFAAIVDNMAESPRSFISMEQKEQLLQAFKSKNVCMRIILSDFLFTCISVFI